MLASATVQAVRDATVVIVNQELEEVLPHASRLLLMDAGRIVRDGCPAEVIDDAASVSGVGVRLPDAVAVASALRAAGRWRGRLPVSVDEAADGLRAMPHAAPCSQASAVAPVARPPLVTFEQVSFAYPSGASVLRGVSLDIGRGEFVALMGPNGAGKTTLAKHVNGLLQPTSGRVLVDGLDTRTAGISRLATRVGYVFQNPDHQLFARTVGEECRFGPANLGWDAVKVDAAVSRALAHLGARPDDDPFFMGLAERKLVAMASVMAMEPGLLVLDEPATGADHEAALRIMDYLAARHREGLTVVVVTHDVSLAAAYATRVVVVRDGGVALDGPPVDVFGQAEALAAALVTPPQAARLARALPGLPFTCHVHDLIASISGHQPWRRRLRSSVPPRASTRASSCWRWRGCSSWWFSSLTPSCW